MDCETLPAIHLTLENQYERWGLVAEWVKTHFFSFLPINHIEHCIDRRRLEILLAGSHHNTQIVLYDPQVAPFLLVGISALPGIELTNHCILCFEPPQE